MSILRYLAAPLAPFYALAVALRNRRFDRHPEEVHRVGVPVVSLGNLSTGGTGKTPVTLLLMQGLEASGIPAAVLSRGHGGHRHEDPMAVKPDTDPRASGDEPALLAKHLGAGRVFVGHRRLEAAQLALRSQPGLKALVLDDGFQHRALHRDLDLLLLDGSRLWGNGRLLPLGDLREPMASAHRAHALVITRADRVQDREEVEAWWRQHGSGGPIFWLEFHLKVLRSPEGSLVSLPEHDAPPAFAWCGLGNPEAFFEDLRRAGQPMLDAVRFRDHGGPSPDELEALDAEARHVGAQRLICTEKDFVKLTEQHLAALSLPLYIAEQRIEGGVPLVAFVKTYLALPPKQGQA